MEPRWSAGLQRLVLACAVRGDLLAKFPGSISAELFGQLQSPRARIGAEVAAYWERYAGVPTSDVIQDMVETTAVRLSNDERALLLDEWQAVLEIEIPADPVYIYDRIRAWVEFRRLELAIAKASELMQGGPDAAQTVRDVMAAGLEPVSNADERKTLWTYQEEAAERLRLWNTGEEGGQKIPTGLTALDSALRGGITRKEVAYFLAPPKGAKTASLLRVAAGAMRRQFGVYLVTYEMQAMRMMLRQDRSISRSTKEELNEDARRLETALAGLKAAGAGEMWVEEKMPQQPRSVEDAKRRVDQIRRAGGQIDMCVFDYLNIMGASKNERELRHTLARTSRDMAAFAKEEDVAVWSACLVRREAVDKQVLRKKDVAEAFEVIAVLDHMIGICASPAMIQNKFRRYYVVASREEQDEVMAGDYAVDFARMTIDPPGEDMDVDGILEAERAARKGRARGAD